MHKPQWQVVVFRVGETALALDIQVVREIIVTQPITWVPEAAAHVEGVINLRGQVIPVIDLAQRLPGSPKGGTEERIMVVDWDGWEVGLRVDSVSSVRRLEGEPERDATGSGQLPPNLVAAVMQCTTEEVYLLDLDQLIHGTET